MPYPATRLRRLRRTPVLRDMVRETHLGPQHLIYPLFVEAGLDGRAPIGSMPGVGRLGIAALVEEGGAPRGGGAPRARPACPRCCSSASPTRRTPRAPAPTTTRGSCSSPSARSRRRTPT